MFRSTTLAPLAGALLALAAAPATAADIIPAPRVAAVCPSWTGFQVGVTLGMAASRLNRSDVFAEYPSPAGFSPLFSTQPNVADLRGGAHRRSSVIGGLSVGYNVQSGPWVFGAELDVSAWRNRGGAEGSRAYFSGTSSGCLFGDGSLQICTMALVPLRIEESHRATYTTDWLSTVRGRVGYSFGSTLVYGTAGLAVTDVRTSVTNSTARFEDGRAFSPNGAIPQIGDGGWPRGVGSSTTSTSRVRPGIAIGAGVEHQLTEMFSIRAEYLYAGFGKIDLSTAGARHSVRLDAHIARVGLMARF